MDLKTALRRPRLNEVFGMSSVPLAYTYVDRGGLDERLEAAKQANMHVAIHGESKHGKSWLRARGLRDEECARVQCVPGMTAEAVLESALGQLVANARVRLRSTDSLESTVGGELGGGVGAVRARAGGEITQSDRREVEEVPVGQGPHDLGWVAAQFRQHARRPVFEDFHNLAPDEQKRMAFAIKALGEWNVPCVVVGIWTDNHLLAYYNGELDGRIEDLHLRWKGEELLQVVDQGCAALNVRLTDSLRNRLVADAYTSVGLLQQLARELLREAGVQRRTLRRRDVPDNAYGPARARVIDSLSARFNPFVDELPKKDDGQEDAVLGHVLWAVTARFDDGDLLAGVALAQLSSELTIVDSTITEDQAMAVLRRLEVAHREHGIHPVVLAFDPVRRCLVLADRRFLLYRQRTRAWPWEP